MKINKNEIFMTYPLLPYNFLMSLFKLGAIRIVHYLGT